MSIHLHSSLTVLCFPSPEGLWSCCRGLTFRSPPQSMLPSIPNLLSTISSASKARLTTRYDHLIVLPLSEKDSGNGHKLVREHLR